jgi:hypothetical protein
MGTIRKLKCSEQGPRTAVALLEYLRCNLCISIFECRKSPSFIGLDRDTVGTEQCVVRGLRHVHFAPPAETQPPLILTAHYSHPLRARVAMASPLMVTRNGTGTDALNSDNAFGPASLTRDFDFTLTLEQSILSILPSALLILVGTIRLIQLFPRTSRTSPSIGHTLKTVSIGLLYCSAAVHTGIWEPG